MPKPGKLSTEMQKDILLQLWADPQSVKARAVEDSPEGKWIDLQMQRSTNLGMFILAAIALIPPYFIQNLPPIAQRTPFSETLIAWTLLFSIGHTVIFRRMLSSVALRLACLKLREFFQLRRVGEDDLDKGLDSYFSASPLDARTRLLRFWEKSAFASPFHYRFVWWWMLIFGLASVQIEYEHSMSQKVAPHVESLLLSELAISLLKVCIVSVIAFIATNIIREVLTLRERYADNIVKAQNLTDQLDEMAPKIDEMKRTVEPLVSQLYSVLSNCISTLQLSTKLSDFAADLRRLEPKVAQQSQRFLENVSAQVDNFVDQIGKSRDGHQNLWLLTTLNRYIQTQRRILNTRERRIITRFSDLAQLARELVEFTFPSEEATPNTAEAPRIEFYALLVLPPNRFLNYGQVDAYEGGVIGDENWEYYLEGNRKSVARRIRQHRYFLAVRGARNSTTPEVNDVESERVKSILRKWVKVDENRVPVKVNVDGEDSLQRYLIEDRPTDEHGDSWRRLGTVLAEIYHSPDCCKIREFDFTKFTSNFIDARKRKPLDYFAVRRDNQWVFCLETVYDKDLDVADVSIFYDDPQNLEYRKVWNSLQEKLDAIFFEKNGNGRIVGIQEYADDMKGASGERANTKEGSRRVKAHLGK